MRSIDYAVNKSSKNVRYFLYYYSVKKQSKNQSSKKKKALLVKLAHSFVYNLNFPSVTDCKSAHKFFPSLCPCPCTTISD